MENGPIQYSVSQSKDGKWRIDTAQLKGEVTHHSFLAEEFASEAEAIERIHILTQR